MNESVASPRLTRPLKLSRGATAWTCGLDSTAGALPGVIGDKVGKRVGRPGVEVARLVHADVAELGVDRRFAAEPEIPLDEAAGEDQRGDAEGDGGDRHQRTAALAQHRTLSDGDFAVHQFNHHDAAGRNESDREGKPRSDRSGKGRRAPKRLFNISNFPIKSRPRRPRKKPEWPRPRSSGGSGVCDWLPRPTHVVDAKDQAPTRWIGCRVLDGYRGVEKFYSYPIRTTGDGAIFELIH